MRGRVSSCAAALVLLLGCGGDGSGAPEKGLDGAVPSEDATAVTDDGGGGADGGGGSSDTGADAATSTACDGAVGTAIAPDLDASTRATTYFITSISLQNDLCLPDALSVDNVGQAQCRVFIVPAVGDDCSAVPGLTAAAADVASAVREQAQADASQSVCVLPQLPASDWVCGSCAGSTKAGWCYVNNALAGGCRSIVTSSSVTVPSALLGCGATDAEVAPSSSAASVGTSCVPSQELSPSFAGFNDHEVTLDEDNAACGGGLCLVDHFQGLTQCPYGQDSQGNSFTPDAAACTASGAPVRPNDPMKHDTVQPQCADRPPSATVYCSCRCANPAGNTDDGATYCACPAGYGCVQTIPPVQSADPRAGGYCVKNGAPSAASIACTTL